MRFVLVAMMLAVAVRANPVNFTDCGTGNVKSVDVVPCPSEPCVFMVGTHVEVKAEFTAPSDADSLLEVLKGTIKGRELPFPEPRKDPCVTNNILPSCPLKTGGHYVYKNIIEIKPFYPTIPLKVKYLLTDRSGREIACVQVDAKIEENPELSKTEASPQ